MAATARVAGAAVRRHRGPAIRVAAAPFRTHLTFLNFRAVGVAVALATP